jgi:hypothetical protein
MSGPCPRCGYGSENKYVDDFLTVDGNHIIAGGRIVGKTEMIVQRAVTDAEYADDVLVIAPTMKLVQRIRDRILDATDGVYQVSVNDSIGFFGGGEVDFASAMYNLDGEHIETYDTVLVDEATELQQNDLMGIDSHNDQIDTVGLFFTPTPDESVMNGFAQYNTSYETWYIPQSAADHVSGQKILQMREQMQYRAYLCESVAQYWSGDEPTVRPDRNYGSI